MTPTPAAAAPTACPIAQCQTEINQLSISLIRQIRAAKRLIKNGPCSTCATDPDICPVLADFDRSINTALQQISDEWNLNEGFSPQG